MNEVKKQFIGILATLLVMYFGYLFVTDRAELTIHSTPVFSTSFSNPNTDYFQQSFTVRNKGNKAATSIAFLSDSEVIKYQVLKASESDEVNRADNAKRMDFGYSNLNPGAEFTVIALFDEQEPSYPKVTHSEGIAEAVGADDGGVLFWSLLGIFIASMTIYSISSARFEWLSHIYIVKSTAFFKLVKPWYITDKQYNKLLDWAIEVVFTPRRDAYKPDFSDFESLKKAAEAQEHINRFSNEYKTKIYEKIDSAFLVEAKSAILQIESLEALESWYIHLKPKFLSDQAWNSFLRLLNRQLDIILPFGNTFQDDKTEIQIISTLKKNTVVGLTHSQFLEHKEKLEKSLYRILVGKIIQRYNGYEIKMDLIDESIDYIKQSDKEHLKELIKAINILKSDFLNPQWIISPKELKEKLSIKPTWIDEEAWNNLKSLYSQIMTNYELIVELKEIKSLINDLLDSEIDVSEFNLDELKESLAKLKNKKKNIENADFQVASIESAWSAKTELLQRQLDFIDKALVEPALLERQEYPYNLFKKKNWENLMRVASIIVESDKVEPN